MLFRSRVKYSPQRKKLAIHNLPLTPGKRCPTAKLEAELNLDPEGPMPELLKLEERPLVKEEPIKAKGKGAVGLEDPEIPKGPVGTGGMNTPLRARIRGVLMISVLKAAKSQYVPAPAAESKAAEAGTKRIEATVIERCRLLHFLYAQSRVLAGIPAGAVPRRPHTCC